MLKNVKKPITLILLLCYLLGTTTSWSITEDVIFSMPFVTSNELGLPSPVWDYKSEDDLLKKLSSLAEIKTPPELESSKNLLLIFKLLNFLEFVKALDKKKETETDQLKVITASEILLDSSILSVLNDPPSLCKAVLKILHRKYGVNFEIHKADKQYRPKIDKDNKIHLPEEFEYSDIIHEMFHFFYRNSNMPLSSASVAEELFRLILRGKSNQVEVKGVSEYESIKNPETLAIRDGGWKKAVEILQMMMFQQGIWKIVKAFMKPVSEKDSPHSVFSRKQLFGRDGYRRNPYDHSNDDRRDNNKRVNPFSSSSDRRPSFSNKRRKSSGPYRRSNKRVNLFSSRSDRRPNSSRDNNKRVNPFSSSSDRRPSFSNKRRKSSGPYRRSNDDRRRSHDFRDGRTLNSYDSYSNRSNRGHNYSSRRNHKRDYPFSSRSNHKQRNPSRRPKRGAKFSGNSKESFYNLYLSNLSQMKNCPEITEQYQTCVKYLESIKAVDSIIGAYVRGGYFMYRHLRNLKDKSSYFNEYTDAVKLLAKNNAKVAAAYASNANHFPQDIKNDEIMQDCFTKYTTAVNALAAKHPKVAAAYASNANHFPQDIKNDDIMQDCFTKYTTAVNALAAKHPEVAAAYASNANHFAQDIKNDEIMKDCFNEYTDAVNALAAKHPEVAAAYASNAPHFPHHIKNDNIMQGCFTKYTDAVNALAAKHPKVAAAYASNANHFAHHIKNDDIMEDCFTKYTTAVNALAAKHPEVAAAYASNAPHFAHHIKSDAIMQGCFTKYTDAVKDLAKSNAKVAAAYASNANHFAHHIKNDEIMKDCFNEYTDAVNALAAKHPEVAAAYASNAPHFAQDIKNDDIMKGCFTKYTDAVNALAANHHPKVAAAYASHANHFPQDIKNDEIMQDCFTKYTTAVNALAAKHPEVAAAYASHATHFAQDIKNDEIMQGCFTKYTDAVKDLAKTNIFFAKICAENASFVVKNTDQNRLKKRSLENFIKELTEMAREKNKTYLKGANEKIKIDNVIISFYFSEYSSFKRKKLKISEGKTVCFENIDGSFNVEVKYEAKSNVLYLDLEEGEVVEVLQVTVKVGKRESYVFSVETDEELSSLLKLIVHMYEGNSLKTKSYFEQLDTLLSKFFKEKDFVKKQKEQALCRIKTAFYGVYTYLHEYYYPTVKYEIDIKKQRIYGAALKELEDIFKKRNTEDIIPSLKKMSTALKNQLTKELRVKNKIKDEFSRKIGMKNNRSFFLFIASFFYKPKQQLKDLNISRLQHIINAA